MWFFDFSSDDSNTNQLKDYVLSWNTAKVYEYLKNAISNNNFTEICNYVETLNWYMDAGWCFIKVNVDKDNLGNFYYDTANYIWDQFWNYELAIKVYKKALEYKKEDQIYNNMATSYKRLKRFDEALVNYEKAIELDINNPIRYIRPSLLYAYIWNKQKALEFTQKFFDKWWSIDGFNYNCKVTTQWWEELKKIYNR